MSQIIQTPAELMQYIQTPDARNLIAFQVLTRNGNYTPVSKLSGLFGQYGVVGTKPFQPLRGSKFSGLMYQQHTIIDTNNATIYQPEDLIHGFTLPPISFNMTSDIIADSIGTRWKIGRDGIIINPSASDEIISRAQDMTDILNYSTEIWMFLALKYGFNPNLKDFDQKGVFTAFNDMNFLNAWGEQRPTGAKYPIVNGATVTFTAAGSLRSYVEKIIDTLSERAINSKTPIAIKNGAIVLCGRDFFRAVENSPDLLEELKNPSQYYGRVTLKDVSLPYGQNQQDIFQTIEYRGVYFVYTNWDVIVGSTSRQLLEYKESLALPIMDQTIVDRVDFYTQSVASSSIDGVPGPIIWTKKADDDTSVTLGIRGNLGVVNKYPELALINPLA